MNEKFQIGISYEQAEEIVQKELLDSLQYPEGVPKKTMKAFKRVLKWYTPHEKYQEWVRNGDIK